MDSELKDRIENKLKTIRFINASAEYAAREIMGIIAPELEKARFWDEHVKSLPEIANNIKQLRADAERWRKVKEIAKSDNCSCCQVHDVCESVLCESAKDVVDALDGEGEKGRNEQR